MISQNEYYQRLSKFLAYSGIASRRKSEHLIISGQISVNGNIVTSPSQKISSKDIVSFKGEKISIISKPRMWIYHKPIGELCSDFDPSGKKTVFDSFPKNLGRVCLVGRLDFNSEGLLLLTNKGYIKRYLELPKNKIPRTYFVKSWGRILSDENMNLIRNGLEIEKFKYAPMKIELISQNKKNSWYRIILMEGKNREIRNILRFFGLEVKKLIRTSYGNFFLNKQKARKILEVQIPKSLLKNAKKD